MGAVVLIAIVAGVVILTRPQPAREVLGHGVAFVDGEPATLTLGQSVIVRVSAYPQDQNVRNLVVVNSADWMAAHVITGATITIDSGTPTTCETGSARGITCGAVTAGHRATVLITARAAKLGTYHDEVALGDGVPGATGATEWPLPDLVFSDTITSS